MFPEYRDLISRLKGHDIHFTRLFDKHNDLDQRIKNMEAQIQPNSQTEIETLKKEKLLLKDQLYVILKKAQEKGA
ncbi:YdcH family protein [Hydrogenophaga sp.]|uniref:YdcH family protein n=1 Tax=Hydrogenophaga sp. TaxID=1904254 RepID=UPI00271A132D|nr:YdcH family protein [Hydrogenophaga sp.]MDO8904532.1 YdcH family protein [Hydrogenophaga sp.]